MNKSILPYWSSTRAVVFALVGSFLFTSTLSAQLAPIPLPGAFGIKRAVAGPAKAEDDSAPDPSETRFPGGAALKTDPEQQRLLKRADQCVADGRLDLAVVLWQKVLDEAGDTLMTRDGRTYTSLADEIELTLASLPPLALSTYRITADGEAQAILSRATPETEEDALARVANRYFLSSLGDDAAFRLACLALDRHDFVGASRLLNKILERHPDPSVPRAEVLLRLAVASSRVGDKQGAETSLSSIASVAGPRPERSIVDAVTEQLAATSSSFSSEFSLDWPMLLGSSSRSGAMRPLPSAASERTLTELWVQEVELSASDSNVMNPWGGMVAPGIMVRRSAVRDPNAQPQVFSREQLVSQWRQNGWLPTGQLLFRDNKVYIKLADELICFHTSALNSQPVWRSVWLNQFELDGMSQMLMMMQMNMGIQTQASQRPKSAAEVMLFGDRIHQSMSLVDDMIYSIEGKRLGRDETPPRVARQQRGFQWGVTPRRTRTNFLAAYEADSGKVKWHRGASDEDKEGSQDVGFLAAPVGSGELLLAPVTDGGTIWLYAMAKSDGSTRWKTYLCDEPQGGAAPWSPTIMAVDGRDAYLTCGNGVVFAIDAVGGNIRWAVRYERDGKPDDRMRQMYGTQYGAMMSFEGWTEDVVIPSGRTLVVLSSDSDKIVALDRRSGQIIWESPRVKWEVPATYVLGVSGRGLFVAGKNVVRRYDIPSGRLVWVTELEDSLGRGTLTSDAIYMPVNDSIVKLDLEKGTKQTQVGVSLTTDDPVGNLYSDGEKFWVTGGGRVYAMTNLDHRLNMLAEQIKAGDADAQFNRMRLYSKQKDLDRTLADLRGGYQLVLAKATPDEAAARLFAAIAELKLSQQNPDVTIDLMNEMFVAPTERPTISKEMAMKRGSLLVNTLFVVRQKKLMGQTERILKLAPILDQEHLITAAAQTLTALPPTADDLPAIRVALEAKEAAGPIMAAGILAKLAPDEAKQSLPKLLGDTDENVQLAAARALMNLGDRAALTKLGELLDALSSKVRTRSYQSLRAATGQTLPFIAEAKPEEREKAVAAWKEWISTTGATAELKLPLPDVDMPLGRTLLVSQAQGLIIELDADHKERWRKQVPNPWSCQGLPNGHRLVTLFAQNTVVEYDEEGKEVWKKDRLPGPVYSCQRLENGATLVACADVQQIIEIAPDGTQTTITVQGRPMSARRLSNGNTLVALQQGGRVVEVDSTGKTVWEARNMNGPCHVERLENGNTIVCQMYTGQVVEVDPSGQKTVWTAKVPLVNPFCAQRLPNGNTLIADNNGVSEVDPTGTQVKWQQRMGNITGVSQY